MTNETFSCRYCGQSVLWATSRKTGNRYLAQPLRWYGDEHGVERVYLPSHRCTPNAEYIEAREDARAEREAALAAGVVAPEGRVRGIEATVVKVADKGFGTFKVTVKTADGWSVWFTAPKAFVRWSSYTDSDCLLVVGQRVTVDATLTRSDRDPLFAFGKRPTIQAA